MRPGAGQLDDAARRVAAAFDLAAVAVPDAHPEVGAVARLEHDQLVAADAGAAVGDGAGERGRDLERLRARVDDHEVVAEPVHLVEAALHLASGQLRRARRASAAITCAAKRSISSACGLICSSSRSSPAASYSSMRSRICSGVPTRFGRRPRFETEYSWSFSSRSSCGARQPLVEIVEALGRLGRQLGDPLELALRLGLAVADDGVGGHAVLHPALAGARRGALPCRRSWA